MSDADISQDLAEAVCESAAAATPRCIVGGDSKAFYGRPSAGEVLAVGGHRGIVNYEPRELVITARAGTPLAGIRAALAEQRQMLAFEPPAYGNAATLGGTIACNLSGPRRPYAGAARDFVLGSRVLNGRGEILRFGGEVMKNVAGYDLSRLMAGAMGTLGILLEVSLKVLPMPEAEQTRVLETGIKDALQRMHELACRPVPVTATACDGERLYIRLSGSEGAIRAALQKVGGETLTEADRFWSGLREQGHAFFSSKRPLWRLSVAPDFPPVDIQGKWFYEWNGGLRWLVSDAPAERIREAAAAAGGHAILFRTGGDRSEVFHPLPEGLAVIHRRLKAALDPAGIFNPGRMYAGW